MNQQKTGSFLKELRREKGLTQEQLAETFHTTNRSVSRWENGKNMPDISLLVELADFYNVDVREIIDGERKSEIMEKEIKEVALKVADYADEQRSRILIWVRLSSLIGLLLMAVILVLQTLSYEPGVGSFICYVFSLLVFGIMIMLALHSNGMLEKIAAHKKFVSACKIFIAIIGVVVFSYIIQTALLFGIIMFFESEAPLVLTGIEAYDKEAILESYGGDLDCGFFVFPDNIVEMISPTYVCNLDSGLFDTDGYVILHTKYNKEQYQREIERLSEIECTVSFNEEEVTQQIKYDEKSYAFPAYVAADGFCDTYEYALVNEETYEISYIYLAYPNMEELVEYKEYLKLNSVEYEMEDELNQFTIYAWTFNDGESWTEY